MAVKVSLRQKPIKGGKLSLYLDYYPPIINKDGKETRREFLKMHIFEKPANSEQKSHNKTTLSIAEKIRDSRNLSIYNKEYGFKDNVVLNIDFIKYYEELVERKSNTVSKKNHQSWEASLMHYKDYAKKIYTRSLNKKHVEGYKEHLQTVVSKKTGHALSSATVASYFKHFLNVLNQAYEEDVLKEDITKGVKNVKVENKLREYLTLEELTKLWNTPVENSTVKNLCFFCTHTGFRFAEASKLQWEDISKDNSGNYVVRVYHTKGKKYTLNPISKDAYQLLIDECPEKEGKIFDITYDIAIRAVKEWVKAAEINKNITLHNFRHTYAVLQIENGTDVFTVSKMLGHKNINTTMIYAKVTDIAKTKTLDKIKINTDEE
ncbi:site-specific integrase [Psychroflexus sp. YR1-1]|uniref:Site-specific integrase n=1 Tax=Psychroflexus aurantiacus TaxID=2709310 RepID=A0A6B3R6N0_9FLAO|nr:site-specific integrase [Psychroflexus aurantiacus]NEV93461.1 site-specific integrase [Psychroflexus aurantiacus]